ncbi:MAG: hypothetical protein RLZZ591_154 [Pseudomonadota bacterium]|jgi:UPF0042 nucleotide-binding protein
MSETALPHSTTLPPLELVLITGMSGSGKSVALHALEDAGFYCVDNLPAELLMALIDLEQTYQATRVAVAMDVRSPASLPQLPQLLATLRARGVAVKLLYLDATTDILVRRYSETRRRHPLSRHDTVDTELDQRRDLMDALELERKLLGELRGLSHVIDTSMIRPAQLMGYVKALIRLSGTQMTLVFESFAFKRGIPTDADFVFDVRMLPNPHYEPELKALTGRDDAVAAYLQNQPDVGRMQQHIEQFLNEWLDKLADNHRSYVTVAVGCTGGQHRSVYLVELLEQAFAARWNTLKRHRELDAMAASAQAASAQAQR